MYNLVVWWDIQQWLMMTPQSNNHGGFISSMSCYHHRYHNLYSMENEVTSRLIFYFSINMYCVINGWIWINTRLITCFNNKLFTQSLNFLLFLQPQKTHPKPKRDGSLGGLFGDDGEGVDDDIFSFMARKPRWLINIPLH